MATSQDYPNRYPYIRLHSNHHVSQNNADVDVIVRVEHFRIDKYEQSSVAVTLDEGYVEVLIYEKNEKRKVINRYMCAENTPEYDTEKFEIIYEKNAVHLKLKKKTDEPWRVTPA